MKCLTPTPFMFSTAAIVAADDHSFAGTWKENLEIRGISAGLVARTHASRAVTSLGALCVQERALPSFAVSFLLLLTVVFALGAGSTEFSKDTYHER